MYAEDENFKLLQLTPADLQSPTWGKIKQYCEQSLAELRTMNDGDHDEITTTRIRARIKNMKNLLELGNPVPAIGDTDA